MIRRRVQIDFSKEPVVTQQHCKDECDINFILNRYARTGELPTNINPKVASYADCSSIPNYRDSMEQVLKAQSMFDSLPSKIRKRFGNDPVAFLEFVNNPDNQNEAYALGLAEKPIIEDKKEPMIQNDLSNNGAPKS